MTALYSLSSGNGAINVSGELTFNTVNDLLVEAPLVFAQSDSLAINLADVTRSDSAGVALLVDWMRFATTNNKQIVFHNVPAQMLAIASASGLDELLPLPVL